MMASLQISPNKLYSPIRYDPYIHTEESLSNITHHKYKEESDPVVTYRGLDPITKIAGHVSSSSRSSSPTLVSSSSSSSSTTTTQNNPPLPFMENSLNLHASPNVTSNLPSTAKLYPSALPSSLAEELSMTEKEFWETRLQYRDQYDNNIVPRQQKFNPLLPTGVPHTLRTSRFQRTTILPDINNQPSTHSYAKLQQKHIAKHTNCCGQFGPTHAATCIALKTLELPAHIPSPLNEVIDNKHPLLSGIKLMDALQNTQRKEKFIEKHKLEDIEWERRYWLNNTLAKKEEQFQETQRLSTKAMYSTHERLQTLRNRNTKNRPLPPPTRKELPWQYIDPLRPELSLLGQIHEDSTKLDLVATVTTKDIDAGISKELSKDNISGDEVFARSIYTIHPNTYANGSLFGFNKQFSNRSFRASPIESPEIQAFASVHIENDIPDNTLQNPVPIRSSSPVYITESTRLPPLSATSSVTDAVSVGTSIDPRYRWRSPARPGPDADRRALLRQHKHDHQWNSIPIGAKASQDNIQCFRPNIIHTLLSNDIYEENSYI